MIEPTAEDYKHIRDKILDYLSRQGFSEQKLLEKVTRLKKLYPHTERYRWYTPKHVQRVLNELREEGIINERAYAEDVLRQLKDKKDGILRIKQKMYRRRISPEIIQETLAQFEHEGRMQQYDKIIREVCSKIESLKEKKIPEREHMQRVYAFLARKGYLPDDIQVILEKVRSKNRGL